MTQRPYRPEHLPALMPHLVVDDVARSVQFYRRAFGFELAGEPIRQGEWIVRAEMTFDAARVTLDAAEAWDSSAKTPRACGCEQGIRLYLYCPDVEAQWRRAREANANVVAQPSTAFWGDRFFTVADPDGYRWSFAQNVADFDPGKIPTML